VGELAFSPARFHGGMYLVGAAVSVEVDMVVEGTSSYGGGSVRRMSR
jgi:hypothetical protein